MARSYAYYTTEAVHTLGALACQSCGSTERTVHIVARSEADKPKTERHVWMYCDECLIAALENQYGREIDRLGGAE